MNIQVLSAVLIGIIVALNANLQKYSDTYDYYEDYDEKLMRTKGMQKLSFF